MNNDNNQISKFDGITTEIAILDATEYIHWVCKLHILYFDIARLSLDKAVSDNQFDKFGYNGARAQVNMLTKMDDMTSQMTKSFSRLDMQLYKSEIESSDRISMLHNTYLDLKVYNETSQQFEAKKKSVLDAVRLVQSNIDQMLLSSPSPTSLVGLNQDYSQSLKEIMVRYNCLNPLNNFFTNCR